MKRLKHLERRTGFKQVNEKIAQNKKAELEAVVGKRGNKEKEYDVMYSKLKEQGIIVILLVLSRFCGEYFMFRRRVRLPVIRDRFPPRSIRLTGLNLSKVSALII